MLAVDDAVELFAQEFGAGSVGDLLPSQRELIERIVNALGLHALAIKLAARYAADSGGPDLGDLAHELENPQGVLELPGVISPGIGRESMEVVFDKSAKSLPPLARRLFASLSAFATAEFGTQAVRAVAGSMGVREGERQLLIDLLVRRALRAPRTSLVCPQEPMSIGYGCIPCCRHSPSANFVACHGTSRRRHASGSPVITLYTPRQCRAMRSRPMS